ncbi:MAG: HAMP domain-containing protein [Thiohalobacteraceae bacterium]
MNIGQKNALFVLILVLLVLTGVSLSGYYLIRTHVHAEIDRDLARAQRVFAEAQRHLFERMVTTARGMSREPSLLAAALTGDADTVRGMLEDLYPRPGIDLVAVYLGGGTGESVAEGSKPHFTSPQVLASASLQQLLQQVAGGAPVAYGNALIFDTFLRLTAIPIENPLGGAIGVLIAGEAVGPSAVEQLKQLVRAEVALFSANVVLGSTLPAELDLQRLEYPEGDRSPIRFGVGADQYIGHVYQVLGADAVTPVAHLLLAHSGDSYWAPYRQLGHSGLLISALILLSALLVGIALSRMALTRPIMALAEATRHIAAGDLNYQVHIRRSDELGQLAHSFNSMLADLSASRMELEHNRQRFHDFAESSSDWLWETDHEGRFVYVSPGVTTSLEMTPETFIGRRLAEIFPRDDLGDLAGRLGCGSGKCYPFKEVECTITLADGARRYLRLNGMPIDTEAGIQGYRGTTRDVSKSKQDGSVWSCWPIRTS